MKNNSTYYASLINSQGSEIDTTQNDSVKKIKEWAKDREKGCKLVVNLTECDKFEYRIKNNRFYEVY